MSGQGFYSLRSTSSDNIFKKVCVAILILTLKDIGGRLLSGAEEIFFSYFVSVAMFKLVFEFLGHTKLLFKDQFAASLCMIY